MATKTYSITMPEEIMAIVDKMAHEEHRSRSEMLREMVRIAAARHLSRQGNTMGALGVLLSPLREATEKMSDEEFDAFLSDTIREVRDDQGGARHQRPRTGTHSQERAKRPAMASSG